MPLNAFDTYYVSCAINKGGFFEIAFVVVVALRRFLRFASLSRANSLGDSSVLGVHLSSVC